MEGLSDQAFRDKIEDTIELVRRKEYARALEEFERLFASMDRASALQKRTATRALSYYGLCIAKVKRRYAEAVEKCQIALRSDPIGTEHHYNLALVYLEKHDRKRCVQTIEAGLKRNRKDRFLNALYDSIGRRRPPIIPFLSRDNPLNVWLGKMFRKHTPPEEMDF